MEEQSKYSVAQVVGAVSVISGVVVMNTMEQTGLTSTPATLAAGVLFMGGWALFAGGAAMLTSGQIRRLAIAGLSATIAVSALALKMDMKAGRSPSPAGALGFVGGWLGLALVMGSARGRYLRPVTGAASVVGGMMLMPWQRKACVVDGPGMPLFTLGWVLVATTLR